MRRKKRASALGSLLIILMLIGGTYGAYKVLNSPAFETNRPIIKMPVERFWNSHHPFEIQISDDTGLKKVLAYLSNGKERVKIADIDLKKAPKNYSLQIKYPKIGFIDNSDNLILTVIAHDISKWHFFKGNNTIKKSRLKVDTQKPDVFSLITSYGITRGGSALAIFKATDKNLKELYIETNFGKKFEPVPFYKEGYYAVLLAWPINEKRFRAKIIAKDEAGNVSKARLGFFLKSRKYRISYLQAKDRFINGKIADLAEDEPELTANLSPTEKLKFINETYRTKNDSLIKEVTSKVDHNRITSFNIQPFYPLKNGKVVGSFGDHRYYWYKEKENVISESYHLGIDLASVRMDDIIISNPGIVVFANYNGIYGNNLIVYHGLGLYTVYGHCSTLLKKRGDLVEAGEVAAKTGATGLALGDHLHFSTMVQGIFVRPAEWMDSKWLQANIIDVIQNAKKMIDK
jgi:murein DD-endopeptidase MepM/ murein hydrolase activator NlpD